MALAAGPSKKGLDGPEHTPYNLSYGTSTTLSTARADSKKLRVTEFVASDDTRRVAGRPVSGTGLCPVVMELLTYCADWDSSRSSFLLLLLLLLLLLFCCFIRAAVVPLGGPELRRSARPLAAARRLEGAYSMNSAIDRYRPQSLADPSPDGLSSLALMGRIGVWCGGDCPV